jgi:hypothetical protein
MVERMRAHAGPWYVHEHVRPFPGVTLERLVRQIRRGVLTATTIVRGPTTDHQWRFAAQTPGLSKFLGLCWKCQSAVSEHDSHCRQCGVDLNGGHRLRPIEPPGPIASPAGPRDYVSLPRSATTSRFERTPPITDWPRPAAAVAPAVPTAGVSSELQALSAAVKPAARQPARVIEEGSPRIGGIPAWWIVVGLLLFLLAIMIVVIQQRLVLTSRRPAESETNIPALSAPSPAGEFPASVPTAAPSPVVPAPPPPPADASAPPPESTEPAAAPETPAEPEPSEPSTPDR